MKISGTKAHYKSLYSALQKVEDYSSLSPSEDWDRIDYYKTHVLEGDSRQIGHERHYVMHLIEQLEKLEKAVQKAIVAAEGIDDAIRFDPDYLP